VNDDCFAYYSTMAEIPREEASRPVKLMIMTQADIEGPYNGGMAGRLSLAMPSEYDMVNGGQTGGVKISRHGA